MKLIHLGIRNYKSLSSISINPSDLSVFIGPNASGKSNFANALSFLAEVHMYGLETAIKRKGGFENIALRKQQRSRAAVEFRVSFLLDGGQDLENLRRFLFHKMPSRVAKDNFILSHSFSFKAKGRNIKSKYEVFHEEFKVSRLVRGKAVGLCTILRDESGHPSFITEKKHELVTDLFEYFQFWYDKPDRTVPVQELFLSEFRYYSLHTVFSDNIKRWKIFHFSSQQLRLAGVPTPNPVMSNYGENLPALVDWIKNEHQSDWEVVLSTMKEIVPTIEDITTDYLHNQQLGLYFKEEGYGRPWTAEDVSDGTILTLGILCSAADPRASLIFIDELENSLHPWIIRTLIETFRKLSRSKNIIITTHSPVLVDLLYPGDIWCVSKPGTETHIQKITDLSPELNEYWENGEYKISEFLDTGLIPHAVPGNTI